MLNLKNGTQTYDPNDAAQYRQAGMTAYQLYQQQRQGQQQQYQSPQLTNSSPSNSIELPTQPESSQDYLLPFNELEKRAYAGNASAQYLVGRALLTGCMGAARHKDQGIEWIVKASKNPAQSPAVLCAQGLCHERAYGNITARDPQGAEQCYRAAIAQNYTPAMTELADVLFEQSLVKASSTVKYRPIEYRDPRKIQEMMQLLTSAANLKYPLAYETLSECNAEGIVIPADQKESLRLLELITAMKDEKGQSIDKLSAYGKMRLGDYYGGSEAKKLYLAAREQGHDIGGRLRGCCTII